MSDSVAKLSVSVPSELAKAVRRRVGGRVLRLRRTGTYTRAETPTVRVVVGSGGSRTPRGLQGFSCSRAQSMAEALVLDGEALNVLARPAHRGANAKHPRAVLATAHERRALVRVPAPVLAES
jgi:hypothetical protein